MKTNVNDVIDASHHISEKVRKSLNAELGYRNDEEVKELIVSMIYADDDLAYSGFDKIQRIVSIVFNHLRKDLGILQPYIENDTISEIMVNGKDHIFIETRDGIVLTDDRFYSIDELEEMIRRIAASVRREFNELNPILDARLPDGSRVNAVHRNISLDGPSLTIRKFPKEDINMDRLVEFGTVSRQARDFLKKCVECGINIFISGGTSSGKTTFLNCLTDFIPHEERIVVIEDSAELKIQGHENVVRMECRNRNSQGEGMITMTDLIRTSLRMRPSRIIVGEVRGAEVADMINACNTGHDGSLSTGHGNSIDGMMKRLESMYMQGSDFPVAAIRAQIAEGIDMVIHLSRMPDRSRKVVQIAEVTDVKGGEILTNLLFDYDPERGLFRTRNKLVNVHKFRIRGVPYDGL